MSMEAHDQVLRTDRTIGVFLDSLFRMRDPSRVVVVLSADHGFTPIPETAPDSIKPHPTRASLMPALAAARRRMSTLKIDTLALDVDQQIVLMDRAAFAKVSNSEKQVIDVFMQEALKTPGIARVDSFTYIMKETATDPVARRWSHQFPANTNVALVATLTPGSLWGTLLVASHGSPYNYDSNVPVIIMGPGINAGQYNDFVRTVDIAPTLAQLLKVKPLEKLDGVPLTKAIK
jgi:arylsulfatase A-like enzyme